MVTNVAALEAVTQGPDGILAGLTWKIYVDMTTARPRPAEFGGAGRRPGRMHARRAKSPQRQHAGGGRLSIMVGGDEDAFEEAEAIRDIGPTVMRIGSNGQALLMKIAINLSLHVQMVAFCEGLSSPRRTGSTRRSRSRRCSRASSPPRCSSTAGPSSSRCRTRPGSTST